MDSHLAFAAETQHLLDEKNNYSLLQASIKTVQVARSNFLKDQMKVSEQNVSNIVNQQVIERADNTDIKLQNSLLADDIKKCFNVQQTNEEHLLKIDTLQDEIDKGFIMYQKMKEKLAMVEAKLLEARNTNLTMREEHALKKNAISVEKAKADNQCGKLELEYDTMKTKIANIDIEIEKEKANFDETSRAEKISIQSLKIELAEHEVEGKKCVDRFNATKTNAKEQLNNEDAEMKTILRQLEELKDIEEKLTAEKDEFRTNKVDELAAKITNYLKKIGYNVIVNADNIDEYLNEDCQRFKQLVKEKLKEIEEQKMKLAETNAVCECESKESVDKLQNEKEDCAELSKQINAIQQSIAKKRSDMQIYNKLQAEVIQLEIQQNAMFDKALSEKNEILMKHNAEKIEINQKLLKAKQQFNDAEMLEERTRKKFEEEKCNIMMKLDKIVTQISKTEEDKVKLTKNIDILKAKAKKRRRVTFSDFDRVRDDASDSLMSPDDWRN